MKKILKTTGVCLLGLSFSVTLWAGTKLTFKDHGKTVKELSVDELSQIVPPEKIKIHDANELDEITYEAFPFNQILEKIYGKNKGGGEEVLFTCLDGYQPSVPLKRFHDRQAYLAVNRTDSPEFTLINKHENGKKTNLAPFYLVWEKAAAGVNHDENSWPYQVASIDLVNFADRFPRLAPPPKSPEKVVRGFLAFRNSCVGCHTLNGDGGSGGPELNYPVNITEYYKSEWLKKWISDPHSIRYKTGMPGLEKNIPNREAVIDDIISYFQAMKKNKVKPKDAQ